MRDALPAKPKLKECAILNLDSSAMSGTHWVAYAKNNNICEYYDSYGNLKPPIELVNYFKKSKCKIFYNFTNHQSFYTSNCGQLCIRFLQQFWKNHL